MSNGENGTVVAVFVNEYLLVDFDEVCHILDELVAESHLPERPSGLEFAGEVRLVSRGLAVLAVRLADDSAPRSWHPAEIRVINVESGIPPMTELLLVIRTPVSAKRARSFVQEIARRVESGVPTKV